MKDYQAGEIRNFSIVGHATAGKTTLSEAMLACSGEINRMGSVAAGNTVSDYHEAEQERKISIQSTLLHLEWLGKKFNLVDCLVTLTSSAKAWARCGRAILRLLLLTRITASALARTWSGNMRPSSAFQR